MKISDTDFVTSDVANFSQCESFYKSLYTSKEDDGPQSTFFQHVNEIVLGLEEQESYEGPLSEKECTEAVKSMDLDKTPGSDGRPAEFYNVFWKDISSLLISALNYAFESGCLSITQRRVIIKLIPKKVAELYFVKIGVQQLS